MFSSSSRSSSFSCFFFFNDTATTEIYTLSLHDALPIYGSLEPWPGPGARGRYQVRRRGLHQLDARPPRLPRHDGGLRRGQVPFVLGARPAALDRKSTRLNSSH